MSRCVNCNELVGEEWSANNGLCTTCARDEASEADTNQASEDKRPRAVQNGMPQEEYYTWKFLSDKEASDEPYTYMIKQSDLTKWVRTLIRTEKLKLLAEVRERVVGEDVELNSFEIPMLEEEFVITSVTQQNHLRADQRIELTKLEAEL